MNLLITGAWNCTQEQLACISQLGHNVFFMQNEKDRIPVLYESVEGVICNGLFQHHPIERFVNLRYIQLTSAGLDRVPLEYIKEHGIEIHNARGVYSIPMAEFAICGVLQLYKQSRFFAKNQEMREWNKHRGLIELYGKNVCIVGCGSVGTECAIRFHAFGCSVYGVDLLPRVDVHYEQVVSMDQLDECLALADVVVLTVPLTEDTHHLINRSRLEKMKHRSILVNIARGAVVDTEALVEWLSNQHGCAVLDVFEEEPLAEPLLWDMGNVIISPHNSFVGDGNKMRLEKVILYNLGIT